MHTHTHLSLLLYATKKTTYSAATTNWYAIHSTPQTPWPITQEHSCKRNCTVGWVHGAAPMKFALPPFLLLPVSIGPVHGAAPMKFALPPFLLHPVSIGIGVGAAPMKFVLPPFLLHPIPVSKVTYPSTVPGIICPCTLEPSP